MADVAGSGEADDPCCDRRDVKRADVPGGPPNGPSTKLHTRAPEFFRTLSHFGRTTPRERPGEARHREARREILERFCSLPDAFVCYILLSLTRRQNNVPRRSQRSSRFRPVV